MSETVIDSFVVLFSLDARNFKKGEREVRESLTRTKEASKKTFDDLEGGGKKAADVFRKVRNEAAALFLVFAGASSIKQFASNLVSSTASASRLGDVLGMTPGRVAGWRGALEAVGGSASEADAALKQMRQTLFDFQFDPAKVNRGVLGVLGVDTTDLQNGSPESLLLKLAEARSRFSAQNYASLLQQLGLSDGTITLLMRGRDGVKALVDAQEQYLHISEKDAEATRKFDETMANLSAKIKGQALPAVTLLLQAFQSLSECFEKNNPFPSVERSIAGWYTLMLRIDRWLNEQLAKYGWTAEVREAARKRADEDTRQMDAIARRFSGSRATAEEGIDGSSSTQDIRRLFPGYQPSRYRSQLNSSRGAYIESYLQRGGVSAPVARGTAAALFGESRFDPGAVNPQSGAFGIAQWLGPRKKALFARYGSRPTLDQQLDFLLSELRGGDRGGASVLQQKTEVAALVAAVTHFLRPQGRNWERGEDWRRDIMRGRGYLSRSQGTTINTGPITINTQATDARGVARDLHGELRKRALVAQADVGTVY